MPTILRQSQLDILSYGLYSKYKAKGKSIPQIEEYTYDVPISEHIEFGMVVQFTKAKGQRIDFCIKHPKMKDAFGNILADFRGSFTVPSQQYKFFLGDHFWKPYKDKCGSWTLSLSHNRKQLLEKTFHCFIPKLEIYHDSF